MNELKNSDKLWISGWFCIVIMTNYFIAHEYFLGIIWFVIWLIRIINSEIDKRSSL